MMEQSPLARGKNVSLSIILVKPLVTISLSAVLHGGFVLEDSSQSLSICSIACNTMQIKLLQELKVGDLKPDQI